ncbi:uncharacterized protein LOC144872397 isoform X2 [Branchiostoma floridae x Branchiostoma japonicum]
MAGGFSRLFLLAVLVGITLPTADTATTPASRWGGTTDSTIPEKLCGDFPWNPTDATVDCDYDYYDYSWSSYRGRCRVSCLNATMLVGPPVDDIDYRCNVNNASWIGSEPVCIGGFDNTTVTESAANRVRLVGGDFYGCVELYDNVTRQWGPVVGFRVFLELWESRMAWADLACRDVGFTGALATYAYLTDSSLLYAISDSLSYSRPNETGPNFYLDSFASAPKGVSAQHLYDTVERVVRGECTETVLSPGTQNWWNCHTDLMCLACQKKVEIEPTTPAEWTSPRTTRPTGPCGPFPWQPTDATVDCDYGYTSSVRYWDEASSGRFYPRGRCSVTCSNNLTVAGASALNPDGGSHYYCRPDMSTWLGVEPSCQEKLCGDFPWKNNADITVDCDYDYSGTWAAWYSVVYYRGRCRVSCLDAELLVGPPVHSGRYYSCNVYNASWTGTEPVCIGGFYNTTVTESAANRVRLVGGDFYGCVELYDDVTQQWGPVVGFSFDEYEPAHKYRMAWAGLVCRDVGLTGGLATHAFPTTDQSWYDTISSHFYRSYSRPNNTGPNFFLNTSSAVSGGGVQHLYHTVERVVRGDCTATESSQDCDRYLMCLACQKEPEIQGDVSCNSTSMWVSFRWEDLVRHDESSMHLRDPSCIAEISDTHVTFITALDECGTTAAEDGETNKIVYTNDVFAPLLQSTPDGDDVITRTTEDRWTFSCHYVRDDSVAVGGLFPVPASSVVILHGDGSFTFSMNLYRSDSFSQPYGQADFPVEVSVNDDVYFGISVEAAGSGLVLFVDNCRATPSASPGGSTEYYIIQDSCHQDDTLQDFTPASATSAQYGISAFKFTNESLSYVYLHCDVMVCLENNPDSRCEQGCVDTRRRRRAADGGVEERATLVQGPIVLVPDETPDGCARSCHRHASCNPSTGRCVCGPGWVGDGVHCQDFDECTIVSCGVHQRCVNTPGSHVCECMPGYTEVDGSCQAAHAYRSTSRLLARSFTPELEDHGSLEYRDLVSEVTSTLESLYRRTSLAGDFLSVIIIAFRPGSVLVDHVINILASADFSPAMTSEEFKVVVEKANGTALGFDMGSDVTITDYDECSDPQKTDCSPHANCVNTVGSFTCSCIMGYQDKSPDVASRPGRVCELGGVSDSWVPVAAGAAAVAAVVIIAIATVTCLRRANRKRGLKDVEGRNNLAFVGTTGKPAETDNSAPCRDCDSSF